MDMVDVILKVKDDLKSHLINDNDPDGDFLNMYGNNFTRRELAEYLDMNPAIAYTLLINTILVLSSVISKRNGNE